MTRYLVGRVLQAIGVVLAISLITFFILNIIPGDPVELMMGEFATPEAIAQVRTQMGLDKPIAAQYFGWLGNMLRGDFGVSYFQHKPALEMLLNSFGYTARLALFAYLLAMVIGLTFGILAAVFHNRFLDRFLMTLSIAGVSAPNFWVAIILQIYFGLTLKWFPISGAQDWNYYVLPAVALGTRYAASISRITSTSMLEVTRSDFVTTARSKGISERKVIYGHALPNALIPILTLVGMRFGGMLGGATVIEVIFSIPGIGQLLVNGINNRDSTVVTGGIVFIALTFSLIMLLTDLAYALVDPRIKAQYTSKNKKFGEEERHHHGGHHGGRHEEAKAQ